MLRNVRWIAAGLLAVAGLAASSTQASAGTLILVEELNSSNVAINAASFSIATLPTSGSPYATPTGTFQNISITVTTTSGASSNVNSLTTTVAAKPGTSFNSANSLRVTVTDDGFQNASPSGVANVTNDPGASSGISGGVNNLIGSTTIQSGTIGSLTALGATPTASDTSPGGPSDPNTTVVIPSLPATYAMTQELTIRAIPTTGIDPNSTFGGTLSSTIATTPNAPVPAPAALFLALSAVPAFGLRRVLRRKSVN